MQKIRFISLIFPLIILSGCFDIVSWNSWSDGEYYVTDNPGSPSSLTLYIESHGRVNNVEKIGSNENYIIVQSKEKPTNSIEEYWILDKTKDNYLLNSNEIMEGPLSFQQFKVRKKIYGISDLEFSEEF